MIGINSWLIMTFEKFLLELKTLFDKQKVKDKILQI